MATTTVFRLTPEPVEVTEDNVNAVMEELRHQHATWEPVERPVDFDDLVVLDIESNVEDKPFINRRESSIRFFVTQSSRHQGLPSS